MLRLGELADRTCAERDIPASLPDHRRNPDYDAVRRGVGFDDAWRGWSAALDSSLELVARIRNMPAETITGLAVKHRALMWDLFHDGGGMDDIAQRRLAAFDRELKALADKAATSISA